jgi:hypothetical protein
MTPGVVADGMALLGNTPHQRQIALGILADHKKGRPRIMAPQYAQYFRGHLAIGSVIES